MKKINRLTVGVMLTAVFMLAGIHLSHVAYGYGKQGRAAQKTEEPTFQINFLLL